MGTTTAIGIPYPVSTDTPDVPRDVKALADWLTANMEKPLPYARASGQVTVAGTGIASGGNVQTAVTFPVGRFSQVPRVTTAISNAPSQTSFLVARSASQTTTGFTCWVLNVGSAAFTWTGLTVDWVATQMTATSGSG